MSELKAFDITVAEEGYGVGIVKYRRAVYDKSEADKVIADLEESHKMEVEQLLIEIAELKDRLQAANEQIENLINSASNIMLFQDRVKDDKCAELRHHKYKRCLAMAKLCNEKWLVHNFAEIPTKLRFYDKWEKRWLELAEKLKEAK